MQTQLETTERLAKCFEDAAELGPLSPAELTEYNTQRAREMAKAEAARAGDTPQAALPLDQAA